MPAREVAVGPYTLRLPDFWGEVRAREAPPLFATSSVVDAGVAFDFAVILGQGGDHAERARIEATQRGARPAARSTSIEESYHGMALRGFRLEGLAGYSAGSVHESYALEAYGDLILFAYSLADATPAEDALRALFLSMVEGAVVDRGYALHP